MGKPDVKAGQNSWGGLRFAVLKQFEWREKTSKRGSIETYSG